MAYVVIRAFSAPGHGSFADGHTFDVLPDGVDWVKAGFVEEVKEDKPAPKTRKRTVKKKS